MIFNNIYVINLYIKLYENVKFYKHNYFKKLIIIYFFKV
jgi:hypothetical protein